MEQTLTKLSLMGRTVLVRRVTGKHMEQVSQDRCALGLFSGEEMTIYINRKVSDESFKRVLMHEICHALLYISGFHNLLSQQKEEAICDLMESLVELFRDKQLVNFFSK